MLPVKLILGVAVVLAHPVVLRIRLVLSLIQWSSIWLEIFSSTNILVTVIRFLVRVPVLSVQILLAPPIVSQACRYLTRLFYSFILPTE